MEIRPILSAVLRSKTGAMLVAIQVALTLAIITNALFVVSARLQTANRPSGVNEPSLFEISFSAAPEAADRAATMQRDLETLQGIPGVFAVASVNQMPLSASGWTASLVVDDDHEVAAAVYMSGESLVATFDLEIVEGRDFESAEIREVDPQTAKLRVDTIILTRHLARALFPGAPTAVGKLVRLSDDPSEPAARVVGVVDMLMSPFAQTSERAYDACIIPVRNIANTGHYAVRTEPGERDRVMAQAERALTTLRTDRALTIHRTMDAIRERRYRADRSGAGVLITVTIGLLLVTAGGIVGVASLWVNQRRKQIGVRRALGARRIDIVRYFLVENLLITTAGIAFGLALAVALNLWLAELVELARLPIDYVIAGMFVMWALGLIATLGPAWRAASVPPAVATRTT